VLEDNLTVSLIDEMMEEALPVILNKEPLGTSLFHTNLGLFDLESPIGELASTIDSIPDLESSSWVCTCDPLPPFAS